MEVPPPTVAAPSRPLPAECFAGSEPVESNMIPPAPVGGDPLSVARWQIAVLMLRLEALTTANDINGSRLDECAKARPAEAGGVVG